MKTQVEYVHPGALSRLKEVLNAQQPQQVFLVTGRSSYAFSGAREKLTPILKPYRVTHFDAFSPNPDLEDLEQGLALFKKSKPDCIIAVGGGSVLDMAKLMALTSVQFSSPDQVVQNEIINKASFSPLISIPTTAGSGSEATSFAVCYISGKKYSVAHHSLLPDVAIVDAELTTSMPAKLTAISGMDAFSQAIESYWSIHSTNASRALSKQAIARLWKHMKQNVYAPSSTSREEVIRAAFLAGKAINITKTTAPHALSYTLTIDHGIPHGHAVALTLPSFFYYNAMATEKDIGDARGLAFLNQRVMELCQLLEATSPSDAAQHITVLLNDIGLETRLSDLAVSERDIPRVASRVNLQRLKNNPRIVTHDAMLKVLYGLV